MKLFSLLLPLISEGKDSRWFLDDNDGCESGWVGQDSRRGDPSCYQVWCFTWSTVTWDEARVICNAKVVDKATAHLVSIDRPEVNDLVSNWVFDTFGFTTIDGPIWIGAKQKDDGEFTWINSGRIGSDTWEEVIGKHITIRI